MGKIFGEEDERDAGDLGDLRPPPVGHIAGERGDVGVRPGEVGGERGPPRGERAPRLTYSMGPTLTSCRSKMRVVYGGTRYVPFSSWRPPFLYAHWGWMVTWA